MLRCSALRFTITLLAVTSMGAIAGHESRASAADTTVIHIVGVDSLTGPSAPYGIRTQNGAAVAVAEVNDAGGFTDTAGHKYTLELSRQDMANDRAEAIALIRQAAANPQNLAVVGPTNSVGYVPSVPVADQEKIVMIGMNSAPIAHWSSWTYRTSVGASRNDPVMLKTLEDKIHFKRLAVMYDETQDNQVAEAHNAQELASQVGYQVVAVQAFRTGAQDFSAQVSAIKSKDPDAIFLAAATGDGPRVVLQMREAGLKAPLMTSTGSFADPVYWDNAQGLIKGSYTYLNGVDLAKPGPAVKKFLDNYNKRFPETPPTVYSLYGYDAVFAVVAAVKKSGSATNREKFQQAMHDLDVTTPVGDRVKFRNPPNGENEGGTVRVIQVTGRGTFAEVGSSS